MMGRNHLLMHVLYLYILVQIVFMIDPLTALITLNYNCFIQEMNRLLVYVENNFVPVAIFLFLWFDSSRAPDADLGSKDVYGVKSVLGFIGYEVVSLLGETGHRGRYHTLFGALVTASIGTLIFILFYVVGDYMGIGVYRVSFLNSIVFYVFVFITIFTSFAMHLIEDSLTVTGVRIGGKHLRGVLHTGVDDGDYVVGTILLVLATGVLVDIVLGNIYATVVAEVLVLFLSMYSVHA